MKTISNSIRLPLGNSGMNILSSNNDDSVVLIPDIGFDFFYKGINIRSSLSTTGNSYIIAGLNGMLFINSRDGSANKIYYNKEIENGINIFRIRFEGQTAFYDWGFNDLIWELILYDDSTMVLVLEKFVSGANNGGCRNTFDIADNDTNSSTIQNLTFIQGNSYIFSPISSGGRNYVTQIGSVRSLNVTLKYLVNDNGDIKYFDTSTAIWTKIGIGIPNSGMFNMYGNINFNNDIYGTNGLKSENPTIYCYDSASVVTSMDLVQSAVPKTKFLKTLNSIQVKSGIESIIINADVSNTSNIGFLVSLDDGLTWNGFSYNGNTWVTVDITNPNFIIYYMLINYPVINTISTSQWASLIGNAEQIKLTIFLNQGYFSDICSINDITINYV